MSKEIELTRGYYTVVDDEDFEELSKHKWQCSTVGYAVRTVSRKNQNAGFLMHREIMHAPKGVNIDHVNGNRLDNRRANLRFINQSQNTHNQKPPRSALGIRGVQQTGKKIIRFKAKIQSGRKQFYLGSFDTPEAASEAYKQASLRIFGEYSPDDSRFSKEVFLRGCTVPEAGVEPVHGSAEEPDQIEGLQSSDSCKG